MWVDLRSLWESSATTDVAGTSHAYAIANANLTATAAFTGSSISITTAPANLAATADFAGSSIAGAYVAAAMSTVPVSISGISISGSYACANLSATANLTGASITWATPIAALTASAGFTAAIVAGAYASATLSALAGLQALSISGAYPAALLDVQSAGSLTGLTVSWSFSAAELSFTGTPIPDAVSQTPAGRAKRRKLFVEIDGQLFEVESIQHAQALLDQAKAIALRIASQKAEERLTAHLERTPKVRPKIDKPRITSSNPELQIVIKQARIAIGQIYADAYRDAEIKLRLERLMADEDDDDFFMLM